MFNGRPIIFNLYLTTYNPIGFFKYFIVPKACNKDGGMCYSVCGMMHIK